MGLGRVGVTPCDALGLTRAISELPGLEWRGITFYPGHIKDQDETKLAALSETVGGISLPSLQARGLSRRL